MFNDCYLWVLFWNIYEYILIYFIQGVENKDDN